jgi:hypothetical protein
MTDREFIEAIIERLQTKGWHRGSIGHFDGPNCLLGAAGYVQHGDRLVVDEAGIEPLFIEGEVPDEGVGEYNAVPGMVRLAKILGMDSAYSVFVPFNDRCRNLEEVIRNLRKHIGLDRPSETV